MTRSTKEPAYFQENKKFKPSEVPEPDDLKAVAFDLLASPNIASKRWVYEQYDSMVRTNNMSTNAPSDAGLVLIKETGKALAVTVDCNGRYVHADPVRRRHDRRERGRAEHRLHRWRTLRRDQLPELRQPV
jgi:phosphoribosylformylglycinamidine (FGAM) synthase-like enzyme